ncbi:MAG: tRNA lysidine(34) synthetase TilS [Balneolaceae bacterium]
MGKTKAKSLELHLKKSTEKHFGSKHFFILGVSGGPDSMALLYLFHKLNLKALVVHINYGKRGEQSDLDQELVEQLAFQWNLECCSVRLNSKEAKGENFQSWARNERYQIFRDLKTAHRADAIVTAHHQDDQVETILQKILRGSSPAAWQGMKEREEDLYRPLLNFTKQEILDYCETEAVPYRTDESNIEAGFARNFIRHSLSKELEGFFPGWKQNVLALTDQGVLFEESLKVITAQVFDGEKINLTKFGNLPSVLKSAVIKNILDLLDEAVTYSKGMLKELAQIDQLQTGKSLEAGKVIFTRNRDEVRIQRKKKTTGKPIEISEDNAASGFGGGNVVIKKTKNKKAQSALKLDYEKLYWPLNLRIWQKGDFFKPLGMEGTQKISHHLTNRKIPSHLKEKALVLCGSDGTIYAIIYPGPAQNLEKGAISELVKCEDKTKTYLTIIFE